MSPRKIFACLRSAENQSLLEDYSYQADGFTKAMCILKHAGLLATVGMSFIDAFLLINLYRSDTTAQQRITETTILAGTTLACASVATLGICGNRMRLWWARRAEARLSQNTVALDTRSVSSTDTEAVSVLHRV